MYASTHAVSPWVLLRLQNGLFYWIALVGGYVILEARIDLAICQACLATRTSLLGFVKLGLGRFWRILTFFGLVCGVMTAVTVTSRSKFVWIVGVMCMFVLTIRVLFVPKLMFYLESGAPVKPTERGPRSVSPEGVSVL